MPVGPQDRDWLIARFAPGLTDRHLRALVACAPPEAGWTARAASGTARALGVDVPAAFARAGEDPRVLATLHWLDAADHHLVSLDDPRYPALLREIPDPPPLLHVNGDPARLARPMLAIVGSRNPTVLGEHTARTFSNALSCAGLTIVSGLALGIDACAHEVALASGEGGTVAVVGTGLDRVYPAGHRDLAHRIAAHGALVSEFPLGTPARSDHFPRRNRILSGLSVGCLVVEAAPRSGSLITARLAAEQGREVFAIPGSIHSPMSRGCHALIRQGARLTECVEDILEELRWPRAIVSRPVPSPDRLPDVPEALAPLLEAVPLAPAPAELIAEHLRWDIGAVSAGLLALELGGWVSRTAAGQYQRLPAMVASDDDSKQ